MKEDLILSSLDRIEKKVDSLSDKVGSLEITRAENIGEKRIKYGILKTVLSTGVISAAVSWLTGYFHN